MEMMYRVTLFIAGIINLLPSILAFFPQKIDESYGVALPNANYELLLRHRAVLFGIIGAGMICSAITKKYYEATTAAGLISMISFILLYFIIGHEINANLKKVMIIDFGATIFLLIGVICYALSTYQHHKL